MDATPFVLLAQTFVMIASYSFSLYVAVKLLQKHFHFQLTPTFKAYLGYIILLSGISLISCIYFCINWRPSGAEFDAKILYFLTAVPGLISGNNLITEIFLCFDRCFIVAIPFKYKNHEKLAFAFISVIITVSAILGQFFFDGYFARIPESFPTNCYTPTCITKSAEENNFLKMKLICGGINVIATILLFILIKFKLQSNVSTSKLSYTVVITIVITLSFEFIPSTFARLFKEATGNSVPAYLGRYSTTLSAINVAFCMFLYYKTIRKQSPSNNNNIVPITPQSPKVSPIQSPFQVI